MESHTNAELAREIWAAVANSDSEKVRARLSPDIVWRTFQSGALTGEVQGPEGVIDLFARAGELTDDLTTTLLEVFTSERGAVLLYDVHAMRGPNTVQYRILLVMKVEDGLVSEVFTVPVDSEGAHTFWLSH
jgi:ketosteroid isomerase-like protein